MTTQAWQLFPEAGLQALAGLSNIGTGRDQVVLTSVIAGMIQAVSWTCCNDANVQFSNPLNSALSCA